MVFRTAAPSRLSPTALPPARFPASRALTLGLIDVATGRLSRVAGGGDIRQLNPQWAPDGAGLYFLSDPDGITNVYRVGLRTVVSQITDLFTGVSGITETSPALSVAQQSGRMVYSVFRSNGYELYAIDAVRPILRSRPPHTSPMVSYATRRSVAAARAQGQTLLSLLNDPLRGLPPTTDFPVQPYKPGLSLTYVGQPSLSLGTSEFGTYFGGGASLYFSDLLGNHNLVTGLSVQGSFKDVNALLGTRT